MAKELLVLTSAAEDPKDKHIHSKVPDRLVAENIPNQTKDARIRRHADQVTVEQSPCWWPFP